MTTDATRPTAKQMTFLRTLAQRTGTSFTPPTTRRDASREISRLKALSGHGHTFAEQPGQRPNLTRDAAAIQAHEVTGHGARATFTGAGDEPYDGLDRIEIWG